MERHHGFRTRGLSKDLATVPEGPLFEGRFGRMFRKLPVFHVEDNDLLALADSMTQTGPADNPNIPAGYTYLGQFIDHDITFDPNSSLQRMNDPEGLVNFRTPRFDLDSLYGRGPVETPFLYDQADPDGVKLLVGRVISNEGEREEGQHDLPRNDFRDPTGPQQRALLGDPRNDENIFVSQLHLLFIKFHNRVVDRVREARPTLKGDDLFKEAQRIVRWHYQWVVIFDFLERTIPDGMLERLLITDEHGLRKVKLRFYNWKKQPFMPVEFSGAAYRFGHSQVRGRYKINTTVPVLPTFLPTDQLPPKSNVFGFRTADFRGFRGLPPFWTISWPFFFELPGGEGVLQPGFKIDTNIAGPLTNALPGANHADPTDRSLPRRNLLRGKALGLPSGQRVAKAMGVPNASILTGSDLGLEGDLAEKLGEETPLWYYVLKEAEVQQNGERLGRVGGRIVAEVLLGLLDGDPLSFLSVEPNWNPELPAGDDGLFKLPDLIRFADPAAAEVHDGLPHGQ
jgi:Animal haem peroxidase